MTITQVRKSLASACLFIAIALVGQVAVCSHRAAAQNVAVDPALLQQLQQLIQQQQQQLKQQSETIQSLQKRVDQLEMATVKAETIATEAQTTAVNAADAEQTTDVRAPYDHLVSSGQERVTLTISGQVNRATNFANDGKSTKAYFVDNDASNSRVRFVGTAKATDDLTIGSRVEFSIAPDLSSEVSQDDESPGDSFDQRWTEVSFDSKSLGKLSLGKGDTASNNSAEVDLSRTDVVQYADIGDIAGGLQFRANDDTLTGVSVSDAFNDLDGLDRQSRVRYDTPTFHGFQLSGSAVSNDRYDASLWWGGQTDNLKAAGAVAIADPNEDNTDYQLDGSFSVLHTPTGLNLMLSAGTKEVNGDDNPANLWGKFGWIADYFSFGNTAFGVDFNRTFNLPTGADDGYSAGAAVVQQVDNFGLDIYAQVRTFSLSRSGPGSFQDITVGTIGTRLKF